MAPGRARVRWRKTAASAVAAQERGLRANVGWACFKLHHPAWWARHHPVLVALADGGRYCRASPLTMVHADRAITKRHEQVRRSGRVEDAALVLLLNADMAKKKTQGPPKKRPGRGRWQAYRRQKRL